MHPTIFLLSSAILGLILTGFYLDRHPLEVRTARRWHRPTLFGNLLLFFGAQLALLLIGLDEVAAQPGIEGATEAAAEITLEKALAFIGIGLPTIASTLAAAWAIGPIGGAALAAITEKPENFGRTLVYLGLAEGLAIYGLVVSILLLDKI